MSDSSSTLRSLTFIGIKLFAMLKNIATRLNEEVEEERVRQLSMMIKDYGTLATEVMG